MDWVLACSIFVLIIGFIIDIIKSIKNNKTATSEHSLLSKEHTQISSTIKEQREFLENFMFEEMSRLQTENAELRLENYKLKEEIKKLTESKEEEKHRGIRR